MGVLLWISRLAVLRSFVSLLSCLLSEFVRGVCSFSGSGSAKFWGRDCGMCFLVDESIGGVAEFCESSELSIV